VHQHSESPPIRLLAVEDDPAWATLLSELIAAEEDRVELEVVTTLAEAVASLRRRGADCVLLDLSLPDASGVEGIEKLARAFPALAIVVLTANEEDSTALAAVAQGAEDFLAKRRADGPSIMRAIRYARGRKEAETELRRTTAQLAAAEELAQLGSWEWDLMRHSVHPSRELCRIYGLDPDRFDGDFETLHSHVHPDDRPALEQAIERAMAQDNGRFEAEYRIIRADGQARLIQALGEVRRDDNGRPAAILGIGLDVTDQRHAAEEVAMTRERLAREHATVETLQRSLLPRRLPTIPGIELGACYRPARADGRVGGDFYDVFRMGGPTWNLLIGDVAGKGPEAAALSALARYTVRADARREREPVRLLELVNETLFREGEHFCTAACATLELRGEAPILTVTSGGHPPPLLVRRGSAQALTGPGLLLGYFERVSLEQRRETLERGDTVIFYTDGVTDAQAPERLLEYGDIAELAASWSDLPAPEVASRLEEAAIPTGAAGRDDIAILVARVTGD
jgi:PAS domain S-box-containing protein